MGVRYFESLFYKFYYDVCWEVTTFILPMIPLMICLPNFLITIVSNSATLLLSSQRKQKQCFCLFFGGGRERGEGVGREVGWFNKVRQSGKYHLSNRGVRFIGVCYTGVLL